MTTEQDEAWFDALYRRWHAQVLAYARRRVAEVFYSGPLGAAARVRRQLSDGTRLLRRHPAPATIRDGYFLLPAVPVAKITCAALVALDPLGHQVVPAEYLSVGCPGDPYQLGTPAPAAPPGSTVTEKEQSQAVAYASGVEASTTTPTSAAAGSRPGSLTRQRGCRSCPSTGRPISWRSCKCGSTVMPPTRPSSSAAFE